MLFHKIGPGGGIKYRCFFSVGKSLTGRAVSTVTCIVSPAIGGEQSVDSGDGII